ncbi:MAG: ABC transporter permease [Psychrosphaera sp.]|nr:ABC transporter permease [Psychrosphaera sp.]
MLKNYLITAYKVLLRRKFFTFIGLFGISLTLAGLLVISTIVDNYLSPRGPEKNNDHFLSINRLGMESANQDSQSSGAPGYKFLQDNVSRLKVPQKISYFTGDAAAASYINADKLTNQLRRTDVAYWQILDFTFVEGQPFDQTAFDSGANQMVITDTTRREYFGNERALGKSIVVDEQKFTIVGVVEDVSRLEGDAFADMWVPYTTLPSSSYEASARGGWRALIYHSNTDQVKAMQQEYTHLLKNDFISPNPERFAVAIGGADTALEKFSRAVYKRHSYDSGAEELVAILMGLVVAFMMLPSINLINLNISRIMERASEIGVRKAFGASAGQLVTQFIVENLLVTLLGGVIGFVISALVLMQIEASQVIPLNNISFSLNIFGYGVVLVLVFGLLSGAYPAWKMARLHPVSALKGGA